MNILVETSVLVVDGLNSWNRLPLSKGSLLNFTAPQIGHYTTILFVGTKPLKRSKTLCLSEWERLKFDD